jgi:hypothetical protein
MEEAWQTAHKTTCMHKLGIAITFTVLLYTENDGMLLSVSWFSMSDFLWLNFFHINFFLFVQA